MLEDAAALTGTAGAGVFPPGRSGALCGQRRGGGGRHADGPERDPHRGGESCRPAHQCLPDGKTARCEVIPVDLGMAGEPVPGVRNCRVAAGTADFTTGPAMTRQQAVDAIAAGMGLVRAQKAAGVQLLATGRWALATPPPPARWRRCSAGSACGADDRPGRGPFRRRGLPTSWMPSGGALRESARCR